MSLIRCPECSFQISSSANSCPKCGNTNFYVTTDYKNLGYCQDCDGTGISGDVESFMDCRYCNGTGMIEVDYTVNIKRNLSLWELQNEVKESREACTRYARERKEKRLAYLRSEFIKLQARWRKEGKCEMCGVGLGTFERLVNKRCKAHR